MSIVIFRKIWYSIVILTKRGKNAIYKLLIADASEPFTDAIKEIFRHEFTLEVCHDGETALELLNTFCPDVLIINFMLPYKDGLTVLQQSAHRPAVILGISPFVNNYVEQTATALGVQFTMIMPTVSALRVRLMDMITATIASSSSLSTQTAVHLHTLNFQTHLDGYRQLCVGIPIFAKNPNMRLSKELYPAIAEHFGAPDSRTVEHSIRKAITAAWLHHDRIIWSKYFTPLPDGTIPCPTNKEFISRLTEMLEQQQKTLGAACLF